MKSEFKKILVVGFGCIFCLAGTKSARAQVTENDYFNLLEIAQKNALARKTQGLSPGSWAAQARSTFLTSHNFYTAGQVWSVAVTPHDITQVRMSEDPKDLVDAQRKPFIYDFKVLSVSGNPSSALLDVRPHNGPGEVSADRRIEHVELSINSQFVIVSKKVFYRDGRKPSTFVANGQTNVSFGFDSYPIDLPDLNINEGEPVREVPAGLHVDVSKTLDFNFSDLYARPVRVLWQNGDPWPAYVEKASGTAVLISKGGRS